MCPNGCKLDRSEAPGEGMYSTAVHHSGNFEQNVPEKPKKEGEAAEKSAKSTEKKASPPPKKDRMPEKQAEKSGAGVDNSGLF